VVAALAVLGGSRLAGRVPARRLRTATAVVLAALGVLALAGGAGA
jgi:putative Ca2+/H+ antiporter (TMEM165/GDT1 family)